MRVLVIEDEARLAATLQDLLELAPVVLVVSGAVLSFLSGNRSARPARQRCGACKLPAQLCLRRVCTVLDVLSYLSDVAFHVGP